MTTETEEYESLSELLDTGAKVMHKANPKVWPNVEDARGEIWDWIHSLRNEGGSYTGTGGFVVVATKEDDNFTSYELMQHVVTIFDDKDPKEGEPDGYDWTKRDEA